MAGKQLISTVKYVASTRPAFRLSEIIPYLDDPMTVDECYRTIAPELSRLGLAAKKTGGDVEISRALPTPPAPAYILNDAERERLDAFIARRDVPFALAEAIERYITKKAGNEWHDPAITERLRKAIVAQKDDYWKPAHLRALRYTKGYSVLGYLAYHSRSISCRRSTCLRGLPGTAC